MDTVTRPADEHSDLGFLDGRDYRLIVTMDHDRRIVVEHQHADDRIARRDMTRLAAEIVDEVGPLAVAVALGAAEVTPQHLVGRGVIVTPPGAGLAVMPCSRCGRMLAAPEMHRARPREGMAGHVLAPIVCLECSLS